MASVRSLLAQPAAAYDQTDPENYGFWHRLETQLVFKFATASNERFVRLGRERGAGAGPAWC